MHLIFLDNPCLAERAHNLQERLTLVYLVLLYSDVSHLYNHYVVAQIGLIVAHLCLIELNPSLLDFICWHLFLFLRFNEVLSLAIESLPHGVVLHLGFRNFVEAFIESLAVS